MIENIKRILEAVQSGKLTTDQAIKDIKDLTFIDLDYAKIDTHRPLRTGYPEVIWAEGKTISQMKSIIKKMREEGQNVLITRLDKEKGELLKSEFPSSEYNDLARTFFFKNVNIPRLGKGIILIVTAGTSDIPVAEEALVTCKSMGNEVRCLYDVGVAGLHRLLRHGDVIREARVIVVVAGMDGALASVLGGIVEVPVIAVPTSIGYGISRGGYAALMGMLTSCSPGVAVVNIDNGFGGGYMGSIINRL